MIYRKTNSNIMSRRVKTFEQWLNESEETSGNLMIVKTEDGEYMTIKDHSLYVKDNPEMHYDADSFQKKQRLFNDQGNYVYVIDNSLYNSKGEICHSESGNCKYVNHSGIEYAQRAIEQMAE